LYETAIFWADKAVSISQGSVQDVFMLAQALFLAGHYHRALQWLISKDLAQSHLVCRFLAAQCYAHCGEWRIVIDLLDISEDEEAEMSRNELTDMNEATHIFPTSIDSAVCYLRGLACQAIENRPYARENYKEALKLDVFCSEAFDGLINHHLLTPQEARDFLDSLPFDAQCKDAEEQDALKFLYYSQIDAKSCNFKESDVPACFSKSLDIAALTAEQRYGSWDHGKALEITKQ
jgi:anaphase-promoting complex subunit 6